METERGSLETASTTNKLKHLEALLFLRFVTFFRKFQNHSQAGFAGTIASRSEAAIRSAQWRPTSQYNGFRSAIIGHPDAEPFFRFQRFPPIAGDSLVRKEPLCIPVAGFAVSPRDRLDDGLRDYLFDGHGANAELL